MSETDTAPIGIIGGTALADLAALEAAEQLKLDFLANVSYQLRTPLNAIMGFSEVIKNELFGPVGVPQYKQYAIDVYDSGAHLLSII
ncbi:histidine kinase dimerization/phospho-acceptor domain-containing protein, partial [uncultured Salinisphaera sp.]|uniref:histidine kinase dimerization/phospho-acceptor domain-containing protein n=1 Tax=uncultured Salinisphaera sp. TaxID=359372 RepID=UPI0032B27D57